MRFCCALKVTKCRQGLTRETVDQCVRAPNGVGALTRRCRVPFPVMGIDSDNDSELITTAARHSCQLETSTPSNRQPRLEQLGSAEALHR